MLSFFSEISDSISKANFSEIFDQTIESVKEAATTVSTEISEAVNSDDNKPKISSEDVISFFKDVGDALASTGEVLKTTFEDEQQFIFDEQERNLERKKKKKLKTQAFAPWENLPTEDKQLVADATIRILEIGKHKKNILDIPPSLVDSFPFSLQENLEVAKIVLEKDPLLAKLCFSIVPSRISEFNFWRNYFCRVSMIKAAFGLVEKTVPEPNNSAELALETPTPASPLNEPSKAAVETKEQETTVEVPADSVPTTVTTDTSGGDMLDFASELYGNEDEYLETPGWQATIDGLEDLGEDEIMSLTT